ncbi:hypothetical protein JTE90_002761 [Oedothorax gibbosus]|uniref:Decapping nuclease n=1 Tax=Oedothorax gibbosus TaxID=931172 RepID=A0AAV6ULY2_9ARAC|nr:hypothetical protein JTE90_002761 [Oedothorax gibbosus]
MTYTINELQLQKRHSAPSLFVMNRQFHEKEVKLNDRKIITFRKPSEIGHYSVDGVKEFHDDNRQMKWIYKPSSGWNADLGPESHWDLNVGYPQAIKKDFENKKYITHILKWILNHREEIQRVFLSPKSNNLKIDFVCSRGLLQNICCTLKTGKSSRDEWSFCASKFKSTIYMCSFETDNQIMDRKNETEKTKVMTTWGAKFEQHMTSGAPNSMPNTSVPVNENEGYYVVLKGQLNEYYLLYSAEVDGKDPAIPQEYSYFNSILKETDCYVELKTTRHGSDKGRYYRPTLFKWWLQSFLAGIPKIICGVRNDTGVVGQLKTFQTENILEIIQEKRNINNCLKICHEILGFVKECIQEDDPKIVYRFFYEPCTPYVKCEKLINPGQFKILPDWFADEYETYYDERKESC